MRATTLFLIFSAGALGTLAYVGYKAGVSPPELPAVSLPNTLNPFSSDDATTVYKWQDESGQWHYSNQPPPDSRAAETISINTGANVVPSHPPSGSETVPEQAVPPSLEMAKDLYKLIGTQGSQHDDSP